MQQNKKINRLDQDRVSKMFSELFGFNRDISLVLYRKMQYHGVTGFFRSIEAFDLPEEVFKKLNSLRFILFGIGETDIFFQSDIDKILDSHKRNTKSGEKS